MRCPNVTYYCDEKKVDKTWPLFENINPKEGREKTKISISGSNFVEGMEIYLGSVKASINTLSSTYIEAQLESTGVVVIYFIYLFYFYF